VKGFLGWERKMKKSILALIAVWVLSGPQPSEAQKVYRISALVAEDQFVPAFEGFKKRMSELGYKGKTSSMISTTPREISLFSKSWRKRSCARGPT
jgi:hypothetical protein